MDIDKFGLISIIMAAYNAEHTISQAIDSVLKQTYQNFELLIINDCSIDRTAEIAKAYEVVDQRVILINNPQNCGVSQTRYRGLQKAKGMWIAILDSDDIWTTEKLEKQIKLQQKTGAELLYTGSAFMEADGKLIDWKLHVPNQITYKQLLKQNLLSNSSSLVRKDLYNKYYAMGDEMHEDFAIWLGILKTGKKAYGVDEPLLIYRLSNTSKSSNKLKAARMNWNTYRYVGLSIVQAMYYMCWYIVKGFLKYQNLK